VPGVYENPSFHPARVERRDQERSSATVSPSFGESSVIKKKINGRCRSRRHLWEARAMTKRHG
jgi:hypothetical protein